MRGAAPPFLTLISRSICINPLTLSVKVEGRGCLRRGDEEEEERHNKEEGERDLIFCREDWRMKAKGRAWQKMYRRKRDEGEEKQGRGASGNGSGKKQRGKNRDVTQLWSVNSKWSAGEERSLQKYT